MVVVDEANGTVMLALGVGGCIPFCWWKSNIQQRCEDPSF